jgi:transposase
MGHLIMSAKERERLKVFERVQKGELTLKQAAELTGVSYRQVKRQYRRYGQEGDGGLVHQGRGKEGNRGYGREFKEAVIARSVTRSGTQTLAQLWHARSSLRMATS